MDRKSYKNATRNHQVSPNDHFIEHTISFFGTLPSAVEGLTIDNGPKKSHKHKGKNSQHETYTPNIPFQTIVVFED